MRAAQSMTSSPEPGRRTVYGVALMRKVACLEPVKRDGAGWDEAGLLTRTLPPAGKVMGVRPDSR